METVIPHSVIMFLKYQLEIPHPKVRGLEDGAIYSDSASAIYMSTSSWKPMLLQVFSRLSTLNSMGNPWDWPIYTPEN